MEFMLVTVDEVLVDLDLLKTDLLDRSVCVFLGIDKSDRSPELPA